MPKTLLNVFEDFCDDLPATVRNDLWFMMVMLSDDELVVEELEAIDERARTLFGARTFVGRLGNLINVVSIFDVYFALDANERFALYESQRENDGLQEDAILSPLQHHYADRRQAILAAKQVWTELRRTTLSPEAIATALIPAGSTVHGRPLASVIRVNTVQHQ